MQPTRRSAVHQFRCRDRRALEDLSIPALMLSLHPHDPRRGGPAGDPRRPIRPGGHLQRGAGLHVEGGQGRRPQAGLTSSATTATAAAPNPEPVDASMLKAMMDWLVARRYPTSTCR